MAMVRAFTRWGETMIKTIDELADSIRTECLSGFPWNVPPTFAKAHPKARAHWRIRAMERLDAERMGEWIDGAKA